MRKRSRMGTTSLSSCRKALYLGQMGSRKHYKIRYVVQVLTVVQLPELHIFRFMGCNDQAADDTAPVDIYNDASRRSDGST